ncbi:hypothetical protein P4J00_23690 [Bacillus cereus]|nr:hypothetical protein [Bacillus cereus]
MKKLVLIVANILLVLSGSVSDKVGAINNIESKLKTIKSKTPEVEGNLKSELKTNRCNFTKTKRCSNGYLYR